MSDRKKKQPGFAIRTIRDGKVKIFHRWFEPSNKWKEYDGRLDGLRYAFGLYYEGDKMCFYVSLWGTEEQYYDPELLDDTGPEVMEDGGLPWIWWDEIRND